MRLFKHGDPEVVEIAISTKTIIRIITLLMAAALLVVAIKVSAHSLVLIGTAIFLGVALNAPVRWLSSHLPGKKRGNRKLATTISVLVVICALIGFVWAIVPPVARQSGSFISNVPHLITDLRDNNTPVGKFVHRYKLQNQITKYSSELTNKLGSIGSSALSAVSSVGSSIFALVTVLVLTIMVLLEGPTWVALGYGLLPKNKRAHAKKLADSMLRVVQGYVNGQVILAAMAAVLIVPVFFIMGVSYPIALMFIVFICGLIPMVGHTVGAIICTIIALFTSLPAALVVLGYYILYQQIENYAVQPKVQANSTNMSPLLVFVAVLLGASFGGLLGALVSIPIMGCIRIIVIDYLERHDILSPDQVRAAIGDDLAGSNLDAKDAHASS